MIKKWRKYGVDIERDIVITAAHIPGILNAEADQQSRKSELKIE